MLCLARARDHSLASAICPIAAEAWLSSSLSAPLGSPAIVRPSAIAPDDTTTTLAPRSCSAAMSEASASSHTRLTAPRTPSTRSDEPTLTTMRLNRSREGSLTTIAGIEDIRARLPDNPRSTSFFRLVQRGWDGKADGSREARPLSPTQQSLVHGKTDRQDGQSECTFKIFGFEDESGSRRNDGTTVDVASPPAPRSDSVCH